MAYGVPFRLESGTMTLLLSMHQAELPLYHREQVSMLYQFVQEADAIAIYTISFNVKLFLLLRCFYLPTLTV